MTGGRSSRLNLAQKTSKTTGSSGKDNDSLEKMTKSAFISKVSTRAKPRRLCNHDGQAWVFDR